MNREGSRTISVFQMARKRRTSLFDVAYWPKADSRPQTLDVCLEGRSGHRATARLRLLLTLSGLAVRGDKPNGRPFQTYSPLGEGWYLGGLAAAMDGRRAGAYRRGGPTMCMWCVAMSFWFVSVSTPCRSANIFSKPPGVTPNSSTPGSVPVF
jgi:hypothetical protein